MVIKYESGTCIFATSWCDDVAIESAKKYCTDNNFSPSQVKIKKINENNLKMVVAILK
jgi:hypothetical protein